MRKAIHLMIAFAMSLFFAVPVMAGMEIGNTEVVPDPRFQELLKEFDTDGDGWLLPDEFLAVKEIDGKKNSQLKDITGIESGIHLHQRDPALGIAVDDRPLDRRRAAEFRKKRRVDVDASQAGYIEKLLRQDLAECGDYDEIGGKAADLFDGLRLPDAVRLEDRDIPFFRTDLYRGLDHFPPASFLSVRLSENSQNLMSRFIYFFKRFYRKIRRTHINYSHSNTYNPILSRLRLDCSLSP